MIFCNLKKLPTDDWKFVREQKKSIQFLEHFSAFEIHRESLSVRAF